ncbi:MAG: virion core protein, T7 gp14 family [Thiobacillus sp.]
MFAALSLGMQAAGAVSGAIGGFYAAKSTKRQLQFDAAMADINARISELGAQQELLNGQQQVGALTLQAGQLKSRQRASMAANGIDLGEGNAAELQASTDIMKAIDKNTLEANAVRSAWGLRTQGANYQSEAITKRGTAAGISPFMAGASSMLTGAGQVASSWYAMNKPSVR